MKNFLWSKGIEEGGLLTKSPYFALDIGRPAPGHWFVRFAVLPFRFMLSWRRSQTATTLLPWHKFVIDIEIPLFLTIRLSIPLWRSKPISKLTASHIRWNNEP